MVAAIPRRTQAISGLVPPQQAEAIIRELWPSVTAVPAVASLGQTLIRTIVLAPLGWFLMLPFYFAKILPFVAKRYTLTNRRLMIQRGLKPKPSHEIELSRIEDVRVKEGSFDPFYRSGTIEVISEGKVALTLPGVPGADAFRHAVQSACLAWVPRKG